MIPATIPSKSQTDQHQVHTGCEDLISDASNDVLDADVVTATIFAAQNLENEGKFKSAETFYDMLKASSKSEIYAHLPRIIEKQIAQEPAAKERAALAYAHLAELQISELKRQEAIASLKKSLELVDNPEIKQWLGGVLNTSGQKRESATLFRELAEQALAKGDNLNAMKHCQFALKVFPGDALTWKVMAAIKCATTPLEGTKEYILALLEGAKETTMPLEERLELCEAILRNNPEHSQAELMSLRLSNQILTRALQETANKVNQLEQNLIKNNQELERSKTPSFTKSEIYTLLGSISKEEWGDVDSVKKRFPYPPELTKFLTAPCPIWGNDETGKAFGWRAGETHICVPLFKNITIMINGSPVIMERTIESLSALDKSLGGFGLKGFNPPSFHYPQMLPAREFEWAAVTKHVLPKSLNQSYQAHISLLSSKSYEMASFLDITTAFLWEKHRTEKFHPVPLDVPKDPIYTYCQDEFSNLRPYVGVDWKLTSPFGLNYGTVPSTFNDDKYIKPDRGVLGIRKFGAGI